MIERVARAMCKALNFNYDAFGELGQTKYRKLAHAAIEAMREPTEAMWNVGQRPPGSPRSYDAVAVWTAMIDAALGKDALGKDET